MRRKKHQGWFEVQRNQKQYFLTDAVSFSSSFFFLKEKLHTCWLPSSTLTSSFPSYSFCYTGTSVCIYHPVGMVTAALHLSSASSRPGSWGWGSFRATQPIGRPESIGVILRAEMTDICSEDIGPVAHPKGCSERERKQCVEENQRWRCEVVPKVSLLQLSLLFPISLPRVLYRNYVSSHVFYATKRIIWFLGFSITGLGTPPKLKTGTISCSPVAYQFLRCCPPGLGQSAKITWKLWLVQPPVHFIFVFFPFPFEF